MSRKTNQNNKLSKLIAEFEDAVQSFSPELWEEKSFLKLISHYENQGSFDRALAVADLAIKQYKYRVDFYLQKARLMMINMRFAEALNILNQAYSISPYEIEVPLLKAKILTLQGNPEEALMIIDEVKLIFQNADLHEILLMEAFIQESMKDFDKMFYTLREALIINPNNTEALEQIWVSVEFSKKYDESVSLHLNLIDKNPYSYLAWYNLGHAYSCLGEYKKAIDALEYSFLINSRFEQGYMDCAELALQIGQYEKAFQCYSDTNDIFGPDTELVAYMAECLIKLNRHKDAKSMLLKAVHQDPFNDEIFFYLGECYFSEKNWDKALHYYKESIEIDEYREEYHSALAHVYCEMGNSKKAETHFAKAARCGQEQSQYWAMYIKFLLEKQNFEKAEKIIRRADKYSVGTDLTFCKVAYNLLTNNRAAALIDLEEALQEDSSMSKILFEIIPTLQDDVEIKGMIRYFSA